MKSTFTRGFLLASPAVVLLGCAVPHINPYDGTSPGHYFSGDNIPPPDFFKKQDEVVLPHCEEFAKDTNPSPDKMARAYTFNHATTGFLGGAAGSAADFGIAGAPVTAPLVLGNGVYYSAAAGLQGNTSGAEAADQQVFAYTKYCVMADTGGYRSVTKKEYDDIMRTGRSKDLEKVIAADPAPKFMQAPPRP